MYVIVSKAARDRYSRNATTLSKLNIYIFFYEPLNFIINLFTFIVKQNTNKQREMYMSLFLCFFLNKSKHLF